MSAPVTAGDRAREVLARVLSDDTLREALTLALWDEGLLRPESLARLVVDRILGDPDLTHDMTTALTEAGLLVEGVERVEWGVRDGTGFALRRAGERGARRWVRLLGGAPLLRRTRTTYPDRVTEWEEVE